MLHLVALGVLVMTSIGASMQLLPVATRQSLHSSRTAAAIGWLYVPGVAATSLGMGPPSPPLLAFGASAVAAALALLALAVAIDRAMLAYAAAIVGVVGALAYALFFANVMRRMADAKVDALARSAVA